MNKRIQLSYSSLNYLNGGCSHEWLNKQMGVPVPNYPFLNEGKEAHRLIQDHVSGKTPHPQLKHIEAKFPIVEERDFDTRCKFTFQIDDKYDLIGFVDGLDLEGKKFLEIKTSSKPWSMTQFRDAMQRKIYALALPEYKEAYIITGSKNPDIWEKEPPKLYSMSLSEKDRNDALSWVKRGIATLESGCFKGGLDENGKCMGCFWNLPAYANIANCPFI